jgi:hypothetical protein
MKAVLIEAGLGAGVKTIDIGDFRTIQSHVGGHFDVVRKPVNDEIYAIGYVHDEGLLLDMEMNWIASAYFMQEIRGPVVLVNGLSPDGDYDGENHELPNDYVDYLKTGFLARVANTYNESVAVTNAIEYGIEAGILDEDEVEALFDEMNNERLSGIQPNSDLRERLADLVHKIALHRKREMEREVDSDADKLVNEIEDFLKNGGK